MEISDSRPVKSENVRNAAFLGVKKRSATRKPFVSAALRTAQVAPLRTQGEFVHPGNPRGKNGLTRMLDIRSE